jgi:hypothetical protein
LPVIISLIVLALILLGGGSMFLRIYLANAQWEPLPPVAVKKSLSDKEAVKRAVDRALASFSLTTFSQAQVLKAITGLRIDLAPTETWLIGAAGSQEVAGLSFFDESPARVLVGPSMAALCHELGHVVELSVSGQVDYQHVGWAANGMNAAQAEYALRNR